MGRFDVGGSSTAQSGTLVAAGSRGQDFQLKIDGMHANNSFGEGWFNGIYHNEAIFQEMSYTVSAEAPRTRRRRVCEHDPAHRRQHVRV